MEDLDMDEQEAQDDTGVSLRRRGADLSGTSLRPRTTHTDHAHVQHQKKPVGGRRVRSIASF